jgi:hypothetical protein
MHKQNYNELVERSYGKTQIIPRQKKNKYIFHPYKTRFIIQEISSHPWRGYGIDNDYEIFILT